MLNFFRKRAPEPELRVRQPQPLRGNGILLDETGLRVTHLRDLGGRDVTVAYRPRVADTHNLEIATAVRNPLDTFSRRDGTRTAVVNFTKGHRVNIPAVPGLNDVETIKLMFLGHRAANAYLSS